MIFFYKYFSSLEFFLIHKNNFLCVEIQKFPLKKISHAKCFHHLDYFQKKYHKCVCAFRTAAIFKWEWSFCCLSTASNKKIKFSFCWFFFSTLLKFFKKQKKKKLFICMDIRTFIKMCVLCVKISLIKKLFFLCRFSS